MVHQPTLSSGSTTAITPQDAVSGESVKELKLSKDGSRVIYTVGPRYKSGDHKTSALWLAETFVEGSAHQITPGTNCDFSPSFHPTSSTSYPIETKPVAQRICLACPLRVQIHMPKLSNRL